MGFPFQAIPMASSFMVRRLITPLLNRPLTIKSEMIENLSSLGLQRTRPHLALRNPQRSRTLKVTFCTRATHTEYEESMMKIAKKMRDVEASPFEELEIIDILQRIGIDHLFRDEIGEALHRHYLDRHSTRTRESHNYSLDLHLASLRFRLLRDQGYDISSTDAFGDYQHGGGGFDREVLGSVDTPALLSLFEASQMRKEAEKMLEEAKTYSEQLLCASINNKNLLEETSPKLVYKTLKHPQHMTFARFNVNDFIRDLKHAKGWRQEMADLALMEFERARTTYKDEIRHVSRWWKELGLAEELKQARDEPMEWHIWSVGTLPDPSLTFERIELSKPVSLIYIIDDIFDIYGHPNDLLLFTQSVNRWDLTTEAEKLPEYMKRCLKALFETTSQISHTIWVNHGFNPERHLRKAWAELFNAYLVESKWYGSGYLPTTQEYMEVGSITCGVNVVLLHLMFLLGQGRVDDHNLMNNYIHTSIISSVATILRLWNDLGRATIHKYEDEHGHDGSYIKCYMKENVGVSLKATEEHVVGRVSNEWKRLNDLCLRLPHSYPHSSAYTSLTFKKGCLNLARIVPLMYDYDQISSKPVLEDLMHSLLN